MGTRKILGEGSKDKILFKLILDYPDIGYHILKAASLERYIPNNNPLNREAAARHRTAGKKNDKSLWQKHDEAYDAQNLSMDRKQNKSNSFSDSIWFVLLAFAAFTAGVTFLAVLLSE